uniref:Uncharacterized protein n=1 Tax=viral metagenome TaxID=1070528 RepID=A0A6M3KPK9_9ZZZZ
MSEKAAKAKRQLQDQSQAKWEAQRHRAEVGKCATCAYLEEIEAQVAQDGAVVMVRGQCRLLPPTMNAAPVPVQQSALAGAQTSIGFVRESEWLLVLGDWGCGQHRPRVAAKAFAQSIINHTPPGADQSDAIRLVLGGRLSIDSAASEALRLTQARADEHAACGVLGKNE